jgi:hypothetical protein
MVESWEQFKRVAGLVYLQSISISDLPALYNLHLLCCIPKPVYMEGDAGTSVMQWMVPLLGMVCVGILGHAVLKTYKVRNVRNAGPFDRVSTEVMGGSYFIFVFHLVVGWGQ